MIALTATKRMRYATRRLLPGDHFLAKDKHGKALKLLGKARDAAAPLEVAPPPPELAAKIAEAVEGDAKAEIRGLREQLHALTGKNVFSGWDADILRTKIAAARG